VARVGDVSVSEEDLSRRTQVSELYFPGPGQRYVALAQLLKGYLSVEVLKSLGHPVDDAIVQGEAQQVSLPLLLSTLAARAGFELVGALPTGPKITLQFRQAPLGEILKSMLKQGQCSYGLLYRGDRLQRLMPFVSSPQG
jgi:hypothetical protein